MALAEGPERFWAGKLRTILSCPAVLEVIEPVPSLICEDKFWKYETDALLRVVVPIPENFPL